MPQQTLSEIVSAALRQAESSTKVASLRDAPIQDRSFARVDQYLAEQLGQVEREPIKQAAPVPAPQQASDLDDVRFALKLAEALEHGAHIVQKLAGPLNKSDGGKPTSGPTPPAGPAPVLPHHYDHASTVTPRPQASAHARAAQANGSLVDNAPVNDDGVPSNEGPVIPSGYKAGPSRTAGPSKTANREDVQRLLNSKIAQHKMLVSLGQIDAANAVLKEAEEIAENSSLIFKDNYEASAFPDNAGVRALTKAQARDRNQREAGAFYGEPVKRDNAVTAHTAISPGLKLSSLKVSKEHSRHEHEEPGYHETMAEMGSRLRANVPYNTVGTALAGGLLGGIIGHDMSRGNGAATALGTLAGAGGLGTLGYYGAKGEQKMRARLREEGAHRPKTSARQKFAQRAKRAAAARLRSAATSDDEAHGEKRAWFGKMLGGIGKAVAGGAQSGLHGMADKATQKTLKQLGAGKLKGTAKKKAIEGLGTAGSLHHSLGTMSEGAQQALGGGVLGAGGYGVYRAGKSLLGGDRPNGY